MASPKTPISILLEGEMYDIESASTSAVTLIHRVTQDKRTLALHELANLAERADQRSPRLFDTLPRHVIDAAVTLATDIDEVLTGVGRNGIRRPEYDLDSTSQEQRVTSKLKEMTNAGRGLVRSQFFVKMKAYKRDGLIGLVDGRALRAFKPHKHIDTRVVSVLLDVIAAQSDASTGTISRIIKDAKEEIKARYGEPLLPSKSWFYNAVKMYGAHKHTTGDAKTRRSLAERPDRTFAKREALFPGAEVEIDTTTMDVEVLTHKGKRTRPYLTIMLDVYSRTIMAYTIRLDATKSVDHTMLLAQALTPRQNWPSRSALRNAVRRKHPNIRLLTDEEYETYAAAHPYIHPRSVTTDRGRDYIALTTRSAAEQLGISLVMAPPRTPTGKPHVERMFESINTLFTQHLPGYVGRSTNHRGVKVPDDKLLSVEALRELFEDWVISQWQQRKHSSLRDPLAPTQQLTPNEKAARAALVAAHVHIPLTRDRYISMMESHFRKIGDTGVRINGLDYDSEELHPLRHERSPHPRHGGKWEVKVDPYNPSCVWVVGRHGELIECRERGSEMRIYEPDFAPVDDDRTLTALSDAELAGTPHPAPALPALPEHTSTFALGEDDEDDEDDESYIPTFF